MSSRAIIKPKFDTDTIPEWKIKAWESLPDDRKKLRYGDPGSDIAILFGCICDPVDNWGGIGNHRLLKENKGYKWLVANKCPMHDEMLKK